MAGAKDVQPRASAAAEGGLAGWGARRWGVRKHSSARSCSTQQWGSWSPSQILVPGLRSSGEAPIGCPPRGLLPHSASGGSSVGLDRCAAFVLAGHWREAVDVTAGDQNDEMMVSWLWACRRPAHRAVGQASAAAIRRPSRSFACALIYASRVKKQKKKR
ncbi:hypothetical protein BDZ91DRAFT_783115 [Kalaharituber pfeilii]|nr:hypothetical protein BDZ91DRAFT_783115 [Kalaharituber pfeilii]